jgi:hypothetical protein
MLIICHSRESGNPGTSRRNFTNIESSKFARDLRFHGDDTLSLGPSLEFIQRKQGEGDMLSSEFSPSYLTAGRYKDHERTMRKTNKFSNFFIIKS